MGCTIPINKKSRRNSKVGPKRWTSLINLESVQNKTEDPHLDLKGIPFQDFHSIITRITNEVSCSMDWTDLYIDKSRTYYSICHIFRGLSRFLSNLSNQKVRVTETWTFFQLKDLSYLKELDLGTVKEAMTKLIPKIQLELKWEHDKRKTSFSRLTQ